MSALLALLPERHRRRYRSARKGRRLYERSALLLVRRQYVHTQRTHIHCACSIERSTARRRVPPTLLALRLSPRWQPVSIAVPAGHAPLAAFCCWARFSVRATQSPYLPAVVGRVAGLLCSPTVSHVCTALVPGRSRVGAAAPPLASTALRCPFNAIDSAAIASPDSRAPRSS